MPTGASTTRGGLRGAMVPLVGLLALIGATVAWALSIERAGPGGAQAERVAVEVMRIRDVLTGQELTESGVPLSPTQGWGSAQQPLRLRFVPSGDREQADAVLDDLLAWLRRRTGLHLEGAILRSYGLVVQELVQGQCDVAFLTAASYARARFATEKNADPGDDIEAFLCAVREGSPEFSGSDLAYRGALIVHVDSAIESVRDIGPEHVIAMGNRTSGAGSILPTALFNELGLSPRILRVEGYPVIVTAVLQRSADVGCVFWSPPTAERPENDGRRSVLQSSPDVFQKTRIVGYTPWIPNEPVVIRQVIPVPVRSLLARALSLYVIEQARSESGRARLESVGGISGYIPASDADFEPLMDVIRQAFINDPEGRRDFMERD